jgi:phosphoglycolate phosphatase
MTYKAVIFDFDYTLADATVGIVECYNYAFAQLGLPLHSKNAICRTVGMTIANSFKHMNRTLSDETIDVLRAHFKQRADKVMLDCTKLFEHTKPLLQKLKANYIKTGVVSSKFRYRIEDVFKRDNIMQYIDKIIGIEDVEKPKPEPDGLLCVMGALGVDKKVVLYVGDSVIDGKTAQAAKVDFAAVLTGTTLKAEFVVIPYKVIVDNLSELAEFLRA